MKSVVVFGVFDLLHPGHLYFLREARKRGDQLTVVVARDARVKFEKKRASFFNERERLQMISALRYVDQAMLGDRAGEWKVLKKLRPDIVCIGHDQKAEWIKRCILKTLPKVIRIKPYKSSRYKSNNLR
ncbi:adenylyltransferase/cytidyltransferase family protein [Candidatus Uhrbacteria bacterium]|nr:adenylyltransferase/cytidyltransferase family protein [Candidatus Uhrbacteria bacterium]